MKHRIAFAALLTAVLPALSIARLNFDGNAASLDLSGIDEPGAWNSARVPMKAAAQARPAPHLFTLLRGEMSVETGWTTGPDTGEDVLRHLGRYLARGGRPEASGCKSGGTSFRHLS